MDSGFARMGKSGASQTMQRLGQAQAVSGSVARSAMKYTANNPNKAIGIAAGVSGAAVVGSSRRRSSQNYPMY
jgi:ElaB/YqjD/DUF883 family membrane-anchored ribosome-binding protein